MSKNKNYKTIQQSHKYKNKKATFWLRNFNYKWKRKKVKK